jgi:hypothetical protein
VIFPSFLLSSHENDKQAKWNFNISINQGNSSVCSIKWKGFVCALNISYHLNGLRLFACLSIDRMVVFLFFQSNNLMFPLFVILSSIHRANDWGTTLPNIRLHVWPMFQEKKNIIFLLKLSFSIYSHMKAAHWVPCLTLWPNIEV